MWVLLVPQRARRGAEAMTLFQELGDVASADEMRSLFARAGLHCRAAQLLEWQKSMLKVGWWMMVVDGE